MAATACALALPVHAAPAEPADTPFDRRVTTVDVKPAWLAAGAALPLKPGDTLTPATLSAALNALKDAISARGELYGRATGAPMITLTYVDPEFTLGGGNEVGVTLRPFYLALPLGSMGRFTLPGPKELPPGALRRRATTLPAELGLANDRTTGLAADAAVAARFGDGAPEKPALSLQLGGQQSLEHSFHSAQGVFRFGMARSRGLLRGAYAAGDASSAQQPLGENRARTRAAGIRAGAAVAPWRSSRLQFDTAYHRIDEHLDARRAAAVDDTPDEFASRLLFERVPPRLLGFFRASVWHDVRRSHGASTQRLVARAAYAREWLLRPNQSIGFEIVAGAGELWGVSPERRRFHGGPAAGNFLYDAAEARTLVEMPDGPILRSFGRAQGTLPRPDGSRVGGTRFRHVSVNVTLPVPRWSRPLIPAEPVGIPGPDGRELTLQDMLRNQVDHSGPNLLASSLVQSEHLEPAEAQRRAREIFGEIQPAAHYVIDRANVFALKPLLLFDAATLESGPVSESWTAAGAGIQVIVVTAKLDAAYMRTLSGRTPGANDNIVLRLAFERLF